MIKTIFASYKTVLVFGDTNDRVIETMGRTRDGHFFEVGYYNGKDKDKAIINISPAVGCPVGCEFCDLTENGRTLSPYEMYDQVRVMDALAREIDGFDSSSQKIKVSIGKTGDLALNSSVVSGLEIIRSFYPDASYKFSSSMPNVEGAVERIGQLASFSAANKSGSTAQLQISLISTDEAFRMKSAKAAMSSFASIKKAVNLWYTNNPKGRVPNLSLLVGENTPCEARDMLAYFKPGSVNFRIRKIIPTTHSVQSGVIEASEDKINRILSDFGEVGYHITAAGLPTKTEETYGLASNVTRGKILSGNYPAGILCAQPDGNILKAPDSVVKNIRRRLVYAHNVCETERSRYG